MYEANLVDIENTCTFACNARMYQLVSHLCLSRCLSLSLSLLRISKPASNVALPAGSNRQGVPPPPSVATGNRSYSPASGPGSLPKTSPTTGSGLNTSPHRNELSPAAKSPLLGTAPPGLLPPPEKGMDCY